MADGGEVFEIDGRRVTITNPDKVFFSRRGETKADLVRYYVSVAEPLMRTCGGRPTMMRRFPDGASGKSFFQKRVPAGAPDWLETTTVRTVNGTESSALVLADVAHVAWAVNLGCLGFDTWPFRAADGEERTDELRIDLDPSTGVSFDQVREAAAETRDLLAEQGITGRAKTSGSSGIHVYVATEPRWTSYQQRAAAVTVARRLAERRTDLITCSWWKEERGTRVFVDFNQNAPHKTMFAPWSVRPRVAAQVSYPFRWDQLDTVDPDDYTIATVPGLLASDGDAWAADHEPQDIAPLVEEFDAHIDAGGLDEPWPPVYPKQPHEPPRVSPRRAADPD